MTAGFTKSDCFSLSTAAFPPNLPTMVGLPKLLDIAAQVAADPSLILTIAISVIIAAATAGAGVLIARSNFQRRFSRQLALEKALAEISAAPTETARSEAAIRAALAKIGGLIGAHLVQLFLFEHQKSVFFNKYSWGLGQNEAGLCSNAVRYRTGEHQWLIEKLRQPGPTALEDAAPAPPHSKPPILTAGIPKSGSIIPVASDGNLFGFLLFDSQGSGKYWSPADIASMNLAANVIGRAQERKQSAADFKQLTYYDKLTGLPNRRLLLDRTEQALAFARRQHVGLAVAVLNLDRFKRINESYGHEVGDLLLRSVGRRLTGALRATDTVARTGEDEFCLLLPGLIGGHDISSKAEELVKLISRPYRIHLHEIHETASIGITLFPADGDNLEVLLSGAHSALRSAKQHGGDRFQYFASSMNVNVIEHLGVEKNLSRALENNELTVWYQPLVALEDNRIIGVEALARWFRAGKQVATPDRFIPIAEETGLIKPLGELVMEQACRQLKHWRSTGFEDLRVSINFSAKQFQRPYLYDMISGVLKKVLLKPEALELELTETAIVSNMDEIALILYELQELGIRIAIDDFGTGYSSLGALKLFPLNTIKIDRSFIADMISNPDSRAIVQATISIAKTLNLRVVAEGVETAEQTELLRAWRCDVIQGYYVSPAIPAAQFGAMLNSGKSLPSQSA